MEHGANNKMLAIACVIINIQYIMVHIYKLIVKLLNLAYRITFKCNFILNCFHFFFFQ